MGNDVLLWDATRVVAMMIMVGPAMAQESVKLMRRNAELGMSLASFRALSYPDKGTRYSDKQSRNVRAICSDAPDAIRSKSYHFSEIQLPDEAIKRGLLQCQYQSRSDYDGIWSVSAVDMAGAAAATVYTFVNDDKQEQRLVMVVSKLATSHYDTVLKAHEKQYGPPTGRDTKHVQNRYGAVFANEMVAWFLGRKTYAINISRYDDNLEQMRVGYHFLPLGANFRRALEGSKQPKSNEL